MTIPMDVALKLPAPAKLNLFLHIIGRRDDGYHNLQTCFQFLDYGDELGYRCREDGQIILQTPLVGVANEQNLIVKAAKALQRYTGTNLGADIWIDKKLPMGGGLGGGSSNAATTLQALNHLWNTQLSPELLAQQGLALGADVPIFIYGKTAFAEGVGEQLVAVDVDEKWYLVTVPNVSVSTATVFNDPDLPRDTPAFSWDELVCMDWRNDCEKTVIKRYPQIAELITFLRQFAPTRLTGTGACLFTVFDTQVEAQQIKKQLPSHIKCFVAQGVNDSPLIKSLKI